MNVVVLEGQLSRPPARRDLPSGDSLVAYEVTVDRPGTRAETVPVVWFDAPPSAADLEVGAAVVAVGRVRRRFFRAAGSTQSRTEVVADDVVPAGREARSSALVRDAIERIEAGRPSAASG